MEIDTLLARGELPPVDRATIHPYVDARPGPVYYQRHAHAVGLEAERLMGELEGGPALLFSSGSGATTALVLGLLSPGARVAVAEGGYWGTFALLRNELGRWGLEVFAFDQTGDPPPADLVWLEPCANPLMSFPDLSKSIAAAHASGALVVVDNTGNGPSRRPGGARAFRPVPARSPKSVGPRALAIPWPPGMWMPSARCSRSTCPTRRPP